MQAMYTITFSGKPNDCCTTAAIMPAFPQLRGKKGCNWTAVAVGPVLSEQKSDKDMIRTQPLELIGNQEVKVTSHILQSSHCITI